LLGYQRFAHLILDQTNQDEDCAGLYCVLKVFETDLSDLLTIFQFEIRSAALLGCFTFCCHKVFQHSMHVRVPDHHVLICWSVNIVGCLFLHRPHQLIHKITGVHASILNDGDAQAFEDHVLVDFD